MSSNTHPHQPDPVQDRPGWIRLVEQSVSELRFGQVILTIHEGRVVQIDQNQKKRLDPHES